MLIVVIIIALVALLFATAKFILGPLIGLSCSPLDTEDRFFLSDLMALVSLIGLNFGLLMLFIGSAGSQSSMSIIVTVTPFSMMLICLVWFTVKHELSEKGVRDGFRRFVFLTLWLPLSIGAMPSLVWFSSVLIAVLFHWNLGTTSESVMENSDLGWLGGLFALNLGVIVLLRAVCYWVARGARHQVPAPAGSDPFELPVDQKKIGD